MKIQFDLACCRPWRQVAWWLWWAGRGVWDVTMQGARGGGVRQIVTIEDNWTWIFAVSRKLFFSQGENY